ncbi:DUF3841 domain-containing protein [Enterococcus hulanensis]|uniref:DUF3841 domain-containing protein n=1 Tax=Enterococcus hulanensis TaxID=2559929 RepID=UPI001A8EB7D3|nr:DUF3841 domain-containing protein [Enterococcus hulanensis]MBO0457504.1 DUF3841 domain-containing protein [Enterococcus hulanensis]
MTSKVKVWTKQHVNILEDLDQTGRYIAKKEYIEQKMEDHSNLYLAVYEWYVHAAAHFVEPPSDVRYPIWVSLSEEESIQNSEGNVVLEIELEEAQLIIVDLLKWGNIVNHLYIPKDLADQKEHTQMLEKYGIDDITAFMTPFYPNIKQKIEQSHERLFDDTSVLGEMKVGTIWEIRKEWITKITR